MSTPVNYDSDDSFKFHEVIYDLEGYGEAGLHVTLTKFKSKVPG
jgi:hypothetical protein